MASNSGSKTPNHRRTLYFMSRQIPTINIDSNVAEAEKFIRKNISQFETLKYLYLTKNGVLVGIISIKYLFSSDKKELLRNICKKDIVSVNQNDDRELAVYKALKHKISVIPVVDDDNKPVGILTDTQIISIMHREHLEDTFHFSGIHKAHSNNEDIFNISVFDSLKHRMLWLIVGLFGGLLIAKIIGGFESILQEHIIVAAFIPLVVYISAAVGTQLQSFAIRDFVLFRKLEFRKYLAKQISVVVYLSLLLSAITMILSVVMGNSHRITFVLGLTVVFAVLSSIVTGLIVPFIFRKLKTDPAYASGPLGTIVQDMLSVAIYLSIATLIL